MKTLRIALVLGVMALSVVAKQPKDPKDWSGHKISEMVNAHGAPSLVYDDPEAKLTVYVWNSQVIWTSGGGAVQDRYRMFWVDSEGSITKWKAGKSKVR